jgi:hypothetical protein
MSERDYEKVWRQLLDEAGEDEVERAASVSVAQAEKELAEAGFDVAAERAKGAALIEDLEAGGHAGERKEAPSRGGDGAHVVKLPEPSRRFLRARWLALPAAAALVWAAVALTTGVAVVGSGQPRPEDLQAAKTLREKASHECAESKWKACLEDFDAAKKLDPNGEDETARRDRAAAERALRGGR